MTTPIKMAMIGECMIELNGAPFGTLTQTYGGDTLNTAIYLSRLLPNAHIHYVTAMGEDSLSQTMIHAWQQEGIHCEYVTTFADKLPGLYWIMLDDNGERNFLYWRQHSAATAWLQHPQHTIILKQLMQMDWIYLSGISLAILSPDDRQSLLTWLQQYRQGGGKIAFDSNYRPRLWQSRQAAQAIHNDIMALSNVLFLTCDDESLLWEQSETTLMERYLLHSAEIIILKQGAQGAYVKSEQHWQQVSAPIVDHVVDTTAAGDSFNAGFLAGILQQHDHIHACQWGHHLASTVIQYSGAIIAHHHMPTMLAH